MKYILAANDKDVLANISPVFARAYYFAIYDTETKEVKFVENEASQSQGGAGIKAAQIVVDLNVDKLIVMRLGENSYNVLKLTDIQILQTPSDSIENIFTNCENNELDELENISKGFHGHA
jgi:predicted Fe-Mo cluster-binding NifX family protein